MRATELFEAWDRQVTCYSFANREIEVDIFKNPSKREFAQLFKESSGKQLRGLVLADTNDLVVWDAYLTTHGDVSKHYKAHSIYLVLTPQVVELNDINYDMNEGDDYKEHPYDWTLAAHVEIVHRCRALVHAYGADFVPVGYDNDSGEKYQLTPQWLKQNCRARDSQP